MTLANHKPGVQRRAVFAILLALIAGAFALQIAQRASAATSTVVVSGNTAAGENQPGWLFNRDSTALYQFSAGNASIGSGSLQVGPISAIPADKFVAEFFVLSPLANVQTISYDFKIGSGGSAADAKQFYMNVYANFATSSPTKFYDCRYDVVPAIGSLGTFTTVIFDPTLSYPVTTRGGLNPSPSSCPATPAAMGAGATLRMFSLNVGDSLLSDSGLDGYLDKVVVALTAGTTVYDFEPVVTTKDQCKNGGWANVVRADGTTFKNQGDCVSYTNNGK